MTSLIEKFLRKLSEKEREAVLSVFQKIKTRDLVGLDVKKLQGHQDLFCVRKGKIRVVYVLNDTETRVISVEKRKESTYPF